MISSTGRSASSLKMEIYTTTLKSKIREMYGIVKNPIHPEKRRSSVGIFQVKGFNNYQTWEK